MSVLIDYEIGKQLASKIPKTDTNFENYVTDRITVSTFLEPLTEMELVIEINNLDNNNKSTGHDEISAKIIKYACSELSRRSY